jgi:Protein of unknown function (DUF669)
MTESTYSWTDLMETAGSATTTSFDPIPAGMYDVQVLSAELAQASTGKSMYKLVLEVENGPHAKRRLWTNMVITPDNPNAMQIFFRHMAAFGLGSDYFRGHPSPQAVADALPRRRARAQVKLRKWEGQDKNEVGNLTPAAASVLPPMPTGGAVPPPPPPMAAAAPPPPPVAPSAVAPPPPPPAAPPPPTTPPPAPGTVPAPTAGSFLEDPPF